jgi:hypothetical protein
MSDAGRPPGLPEEVRPVERSPTYLSSGLALLTAAVTTVVSTTSLVAVAGCLAGVAVLFVALFTGRRALLKLAGAVLVAAVLVASGSTSVLATLVGVTAALLAVDFGTTAVDLGAHLGRQTPTGRVELLHATASTLVGAGFVLAGATVDALVSGSQPVSALLGLIVAVIVLVVALRRVGPV